MARKPSHVGSNDQPAVRSDPALASTDACRRGCGWVPRFLRREGKGSERHSDGMAVAPMLDDRGAVLDADEPSAPASVDYCLVRLERARGAELQLEEFRSGDRVQAESLHAGPVRRDSRSSLSQKAAFGAARAAAGRTHTEPTTPDGRWDQVEELRASSGETPSRDRRIPAFSFRYSDALAIAPR